MSDVYIISGCRTAIGTFQGQFDQIPAHDLGKVVISGALKRASVEPSEVDQVIIGQVLTAGQGQNPARQASVGANIPFSVPAYSINMLCGSGLKSVFLAYQAIKNEDSDVVVAGGQENMSRAQHTAYLRSLKLGDQALSDTLLSDGLTDAFFNIHMGATNEHVAKTYNVDRLAQDEYATKSQNKAEIAITNGYFEKEIVDVVNKKGVVLNKDEFPRFGTTVEKLGKLRPCFQKDSGTGTAGNASGINDGAAAVVLCSKKYLENKNLKPLAKVLGFSEVGVDPKLMGIAPVGAIQKVLSKVGWTINDVDLFEINEAFAAQSIVVRNQLSITTDNINITGGAIALGHPIGCSGARVLVTLIHNLLRIGKSKGIAALCIGGGMGIAVAIEVQN